MFVYLRTSMNHNTVSTEKLKRTICYFITMGHQLIMQVLELLSSQICWYSGNLSDDLLIKKLTLSQHSIESKSLFIVLRIANQEDNIVNLKALKYKL